MKINAGCKWIFILLLIASAFCSCVKNSASAPPIQNSTVAQLIKSGTNLTIFNAALVRSGLDTLLSNPDSLVTVFVATDQIMGTYGLSASVIDTMSIPALKTLLEYSIYQGNKIAALQFPMGQNISTPIASGDSIFITNTGSAIYINGISVPTTDVSATNGYINIMAQPLVPPSDSILQIVQADSTLSYFDSAVKRTSSSTLANINNFLLSGNIYTVLIPNNTAFRNAGYLTADTFNILNADTVAQLLLYHMIPKRYFTSDINIALGTSTDTTTQATLAGSTIKVILGVDYEVEGNSDSTAANLYAPNILVRNGVVHKIDRVLHQ
jgi:uncharacterized surface protein with fasciclin (FAS1) repeats